MNASELPSSAALFVLRPAFATRPKTEPASARVSEKDFTVKVFRGDPRGLMVDEHLNA